MNNYNLRNVNIEFNTFHIDDKYIEQKFETIARKIASRNAEIDLSFIYSKYKDLV